MRALLAAVYVGTRDAIGVDGLKDVDLPAFWPADVFVVRAEQPEGPPRPFRPRQVYPGLDDSVLQREAVSDSDAGGRVPAGSVISRDDFVARCNPQVAASVQ